MAKRTTIEAQIMDFAETADLIKLETVYNIFTAAYKRRTKNASTAVKATRTRAPKASVVVQSAAGEQAA